MNQDMVHVDVDGNDSIGGIPEDTMVVDSDNINNNNNNANSNGTTQYVNIANGVTLTSTSTTSTTTTNTAVGADISSPTRQQQQHESSSQPLTPSQSQRQQQQQQHEEHEQQQQHQQPQQSQPTLQSPQVIRQSPKTSPPPPPQQKQQQSKQQQQQQQQIDPQDEYLNTFPQPIRDMLFRLPQQDRSIFNRIVISGNQCPLCGTRVLFTGLFGVANCMERCGRRAKSIMEQILRLSNDDYLINNTPQQQQQQLQQQQQQPASSTSTPFSANANMSPPMGGVGSAEAMADRSDSSGGEDEGEENDVIEKPKAWANKTAPRGQDSVSLPQKRKPVDQLTTNPLIVHVINEPSDTKFTVKVDRRTLIRKLISKVADEMDENPDSIRLTYNGNVLEPSHSIENYEISDRAVLCFDIITDRVNSKVPSTFNTRSRVSLPTTKKR
ncbi:hypothetical protein SAMD00019534_018610, partial [Acytostelium subglobosum LB1]|uniref:hypothetical protein n=1 Tax=Acytostelium subglobosum LB1 TaxID=1410327 RepID=UPI000644AB7C